jgi:hypothetical protein
MAKKKKIDDKKKLMYVILSGVLFILVLTAIVTAGQLITLAN